MRLEPELWDALREICLREGIELRQVILEAEQHGLAGGRTSAVRIHVLKYFRQAATEEGHRAAGHGEKPGRSVDRPSRSGVDQHA